MHPPQPPGKALTDAGEPRDHLGSAVLLQNLLTTAVEFTKEGDTMPVVRVRSFAPAERPGGIVLRRCSVEDEGIGVEPPPERDP